MIYFLAGIFIVAGIYHFVAPKAFLRIMPSYIPFHKTMVIGSGIAEIVLGILLLFPATRSIAAWGVIILLILVFPANIEMVRTKKARMRLPMWVVILRLPLQFLLIFWAWLYT